MSYNGGISEHSTNKKSDSELAKEVMDMLSDHLKIARANNQKYYISQDAYQLLKDIRDGEVKIEKKRKAQ